MATMADTDVLDILSLVEAATGGLLRRWKGVGLGGVDTGGE